MPQFQVTSPDGQAYMVNAPDGATQDDAITYAQSIHNARQAATAPAGGAAEPLTDYSKQISGAGDGQPKPKQSGIGANLRAGVEEGVTGLGSALTDPASKLYDAFKGFLPDSQAPEGSTASALGAGRSSANPVPVGSVTHTLNEGLGLIGLNPEDVSATSVPERVARMAGTGASAVLAPEAAEPTLAADAVPLATRVLSRAANTPVATAGRKLATGAAAGTAGGVAGEAVPDDHPVLKLVTEAAASILGGTAPEAAGAILDRGIPAIKRFAQPMTGGGQDQLAANILRNRSANPAALVDSLEQPNQQLVTGSLPTTGQVTGDMGLLSLEREQSAKNPADFMQRRTDQNAARRAALEGIQSGANPGDVGDFLRGQFNTFDTQTQNHIDALTARAQQQAENLGGAGQPEQHGAAIRDALQQAEDTAKGRERSLWQALDPDKSIRVDAAPTFQAAKDIQGGMSRFAAPMEGDEKGIFDSIQGSNQLSLGELADLRSRVSTAARQELGTPGRGMTPTYARLIRLRGAIQNNLADAASGVAANDAAAVAGGQMAPEETIGSKIQGWVNDYYGQRAAQSGATGGEGAGASASRGPAGGFGSNGAGFSPAGGFAGGQGDTGIPPRPINEEDAARLAEATAATRARAGAFNQGPIKQTLASAGMQGVYRLPEAQVPQKFFHAGPTSASDIRQLRSSIGDGPANQILTDYAASSLKKAAENPDGTLDPSKVQSWQNRYSGAMTELPDLADRFSTAADASDAIAEATANRRAAIQARNGTALGKVVGAETPDAVTKTIGGILGSKTATQDMASLARAAATNPEATQGLRQAVADHITQNFISNTEAGTSGMGLMKSDAYQTFLRKNRGALGQVFKPEEMQTLDAIASDLNRANRSVTAVKIPGGSNTVQDLHGMVANNPQASVLDHVLAEAGGAGAGFAVGHLPGAIAGGIAGRVMNNMRANGLQRVDDLVTEAMLDPVLAKNLLRRAPARPDAPIMQPISARLRRIGVGALASRLAPSQSPQ